VAPQHGVIGTARWQQKAQFFVHVVVRIELKVIQRWQYLLNDSAFIRMGAISSLKWCPAPGTRQNATYVRFAVTNPWAIDSAKTATQKTI
jgi:hypothetical protein